MYIILFPYALNVSGNLDCFYILTIVNNAEMNMRRYFLKTLI